MAKSIDVAIKMLEESTQRGKYDQSYYMDFVKLYKLMYLGYCYLNFLYGLDLFEEKITANSDGPYVDGLSLVTSLCGFEKITNIDNLRQLRFNLPLSYSRDEVCDLILDVYGRYDTKELVEISKATIAYQQSYSENHNNIINLELLVKTGEEIFKIINMRQEHVNTRLVKKLTEPKNCSNK